MKIKDRKISINHFIPFVPLPAAILGICTMIYFDVPAFIWLLNLTFVCLGTFTALILSKIPVRQIKIKPLFILIPSLILLLGTFYQDGITNVYRWINFNSFQINIGLVVSPLILIQIARIANHKLAVLFGVITVIIFMLQPDASLVSAFSISVCILLFAKYKAKYVNLSFLIFTLFTIGYSWNNLDNLEPVSYVENILSLTKEISITLFLVSLISLLLLIIPFISYPTKDALSISLGIYYLLLLITPFFGNFPVILMGYGISPIIGYYIGLIWHINIHRKPWVSLTTDTM